MKAAKYYIVGFFVESHERALLPTNAEFLRWVKGVMAEDDQHTGPFVVVDAENRGGGQ